MNSLKHIILQKQLKKKIYYSFELVWSKDDEKIYKKFFADVNELSPLFYAFTSHAPNNYSISTLTNITSTLLPKNHSNTFLLHLVARTMTKHDVQSTLDQALNVGITNVLAIRGDNISTYADFKYTADLIKFIKYHYNDSFCIAVAGYPDTHPESLSKETDLYYLKQKVDAGADFIISQVVFDSKSLINFIKDCRSAGIDVPIVAGLMPLVNYMSLMKMVNKCKLYLPHNVRNDLEIFKDADDNNDAIMYQYGVKLIIKIVRDIINSGCCYGFHFFTLNRSQPVLDVCKQLLPSSSSSSSSSSPLASI